MCLYGLLCFWICGVENVSFKKCKRLHISWRVFFSFKRVLVQGRRPCFRRLYRRLCFVKCKRLHFLHLCTPLDKIGHRLDKWTNLGHRLDKNWLKLDKIVIELDKWTKRGQQWTNRAIPWYVWLSGCFVRCFCPIWTKWTSSWTKNVETLDMTGFTRQFVQNFVHSWTNEIYTEKGLTPGFVRVFSSILSICPDFRNFSLKFF